MDMKRRLFALAGAPVLCLFTAVVLAGDLDTPDPTEKSTSITDPGVIKNKNQCGGPDIAFFKNAFPALTNGTDGGCKTIVFPVGDKNVPMEVCWGPFPDKGLADNAFEVSLDGGLLWRLGVSVDTNDWIYEYADIPVLDDRIYNFYSDDRETAGDVAHLDICMEAADTVAPQISEILVVPSSDGTTVSGEISIITSITDESAQVVEIEIVDSAGVPIIGSLIVGPEIMDCDPFVEDCMTYTWTLDTSEIPEGDYTIKVTSTDDTVLAKSSFTTKDITVVRSLVDCLEGNDGVPTGEESDNGCDFTGFLQLEYPEDLRGVADQFFVTQGVIPVRTGVLSENPRYDEFLGYCDSEANPLIVYDVRIDPDDGKTLLPLADIPAPGNSDGTVNLYDLFDIEGHYDEFHPDVDYVTDPALLPRDITLVEAVGSPCLALIHQDSPDFVEFPVNIFYQNGPVYTVTQLYENVPGIFGPERYTAPLGFCDVGDPDCAPIPDCFGDETVKCFQPDPQLSGEAAYSPDFPEFLVRPFVGVFTNDNFNPPRSSGYKGSFFPGGTRTICRDELGQGIGPVDPGDPGFLAYLETIYQCQIDIAGEYEADTRQALIEWDERDPRTLFTPVNDLFNWLNRARSQIKVEQFGRCVRWLDRLEDEIINGAWTIDEFNDPGRALTYTRNLNWRCQKLGEIQNYLESQP
jgi:hypothetical protein